MERPAISVIIPVYNQETYLRQCLDSVVCQTLKEIEVICVDDGSTDASSEILQNYAQQDSRIILVRQENRGAGAARNRGLELAGGVYTYFMDSDDWLERDALEQLCQTAEEEELDVLCFDAATFFENEELAVRFSKFTDNYKRHHEYAGVSSGQTMFVQMRENREYRVPAWMYLIKTALLRERRIRFPEGIVYEDNPFTLQVLMCAKRAAHIPGIYYNRRIHTNSVMTKPVDFQSAYCYLACYRMMNRIMEDEAENLTPETSDAVEVLVGQQLRLARTQYMELSREERERNQDSETPLFRVLISEYCKQVRRFRKSQKDLEQIERQREQKQSELEQANQKKEELTERLRQANQKKEELTERLRQANVRLQQTKDEKTELNARLRQANAEKAEARERMKQACAEKSEMHDRLLQAYAEKSEARERMLQAYAEKSEMHDRMLQAYEEKTEVRQRMLRAYEEKTAVRAEMKSAYAQRDVYRDELREARQTMAEQAAQNEALRAELSKEQKRRQKLEASRAYRIGRMLTWPVRRLKALLKRRK